MLVACSEIILVSFAVFIIIAIVFDTYNRIKLFKLRKTTDKETKGIIGIDCGNPLSFPTSLFKNRKEKAIKKLIVSIKIERILFVLSIITILSRFVIDSIISK